MGVGISLLGNVSFQLHGKLMPLEMLHIHPFDVCVRVNFAVH